eukprot:3221-Eustigmatos_ZCMA.PRE.1
MSTKLAVSTAHHTDSTGPRNDHETNLGIVSVLFGQWRWRNSVLRIREHLGMSPETGAAV